MKGSLKNSRVCKAHDLPIHSHRRLDSLPRHSRKTRWCQWPAPRRLWTGNVRQGQGRDQLNAPWFRMGRVSTFFAPPSKVISQQLRHLPLPYSSTLIMLRSEDAEGEGDWCSLRKICGHPKRVSFLLFSIRFRIKDPPLTGTPQS